MKILLHGINYSPELTGVGKYTGELGAWLAEQGHEVQAVVAPPYYPAWKVVEPYSSTRYGAEFIEGVHVIRAPLYVPAHPSGLKRLIHLVSFAMSSFPVMLGKVRWRPDIVIVFEPTFTVVPQALLVAKLCGARSWLHVQDFEIDAGFHLGIMSGGGVAARVVSNLESFWMRRFDRVSAISHSMVARLKRKGITADRARLFENWADLRQYQQVPVVCGLDRPGQFEVPGIKSEDRVVLYSGNLGEKQGLEQLLEAARQLQGEPHIQFVVCGDGAAKDRLTSISKQLGLSNVRFLPPQPAATFPQLLRRADLHLVLQRRHAADLVMPSKLIGICAVGGASIVTADEGTELFRVAHDFSLAAVIPPEDPALLATEIRKLIHNEPERRRIGVAALAYAQERLEKQAILSRFEKGLSELLHR